MSKIFCVITESSVGGTFLDWSIHWLSGEDKFYNLDLGWIELINNPITSNNAHNHQRNHVAGYVRTVSAVNKLKSIHTNNSLSIYTGCITVDHSIEELEIPKDQIIDFSSEIKEYISENFKKSWEYCNINHIPLIYLKLNYPVIYNLELRTLTKKDYEQSSYNTIDEARTDFLNLFFNDADKWIESSIWEKREWIALNIRPYDFLRHDGNIDFSIPHLYIDAQELWFDGESVLQKIMDYLEIKIDTNRLESWVPVYQQWQKIQTNLLRFAWNIDYICDAIVNNHYYDISNYNLDLWHEAIIQHCLLYKYNLNLKSWRLEKFPANTQDLHKLLESNTLHKLDDIYGLLKDI
jgi:hypothetical protein